MLGIEELSRQDRKTVYRARRLERFLTQPFFTTTQFTGLAGKLVDIQDTIEGCERILNDEFSEYPESAVYMIGAILLIIAPLIVPLLMQLLGLLTGMVQAYIFAVLAAVYISAGMDVTTFK
jgi:predicted membrane chloride channel (bestrophin family)